MIGRAGRKKHHGCFREQVEAGIVDEPERVVAHCDDDVEPLSFVLREQEVSECEFVLMKWKLRLIDEFRVVVDAFGKCAVQDAGYLVIADRYKLRGSSCRV